MKKELPEEIDEALKNFKSFESEKDHERRIIFFENGINILNDYLEENPETPYKDKISNIKISSTRGRGLMVTPPALHPP